MHTYHQSRFFWISNIIIRIICVIIAFYILALFILNKAEINSKNILILLFGIALAFFVFLRGGNKVFISGKELRIEDYPFGLTKRALSIPWSSITYVKASYKELRWFSQLPLFLLDIGYVKDFKTKVYTLNYQQLSNKQNLLNEISHYAGKRLEESPRAIIIKTQAPFLLKYLFHIIFAAMVIILVFLFK